MIKTFAQEPEKAVGLVATDRRASRTMILAFLTLLLARFYIVGTTNRLFEYFRENPPFDIFRFPKILTHVDIGVLSFTGILLLSLVVWEWKSRALSTYLARVGTQSRSGLYLVFCFS